MINNFLLEANTGVSAWLLPVVLLVLIVLMFVLPTISKNKQYKQYQEMQSELKAGDKIQTVGGIVGRIVKVKDNKEGYKTILLETGENGKKTILEFHINAVAGVVSALPNNKAVATACGCDECCEHDNETDQSKENTEQPEIVDVDFDKQIEDSKIEKNDNKKNKNKK